jgi:ArsR family metal-binding transcriptional regulator
VDYSTTFASGRDLENASQALTRGSIPFHLYTAEPGYNRVGTAALRTGMEGRALLGEIKNITCAGWVEYRQPAVEVPASQPPQFAEDQFGQAAVVYLAPCVADLSRIRLIAHVSGDLTQVLPYLNSSMPGAFYSHELPSLTLMDGYRMVVLCPKRISVAKADELVDGWKTLETLRNLINQTWQRRAEIAPSTLSRQKPPALEIYKRLPGTNCRECGEKTCMAFALRLWKGELKPALCKPVFKGDRTDLQSAFLEICAGLGI